MTKQRGTLISIEGIDGCGKSTLSSLLYKTLSSNPHNLECLLTQEPSKTALGKSIRTLLSEQTTPLSYIAEFLLFAADRAEHFKSVVLPALHNNLVVISDRLSDSSLAYQGYGRGVDLSFINGVNTTCMQNRTPDVVIYLRIDIETALYRIHHRKLPLTSFEQETRTFWDRVINGFDEIFKNRKNCIIVDGTAPVEVVVEETVKQLQPFLIR